VISRRRFVAAATVGAFALPVAGRAQQPLKEARIGVFAGAPDIAFRGAFVSALRELGLVEGRNLAIDRRRLNEPAPNPSCGERACRRAPATRADGPRCAGRHPGDGAFAEGRGMGAIVVPHQAELCHGGPSLRAAKQEITATPVVMFTVGDLVASGWVKNLARPEGNVTGVAGFARDLAAKRAALLKEIMPSSKPAVSLPTARTTTRCRGVSRSTWTRYCGAPSRAICRLSFPPSSSW